MQKKPFAVSKETLPFAEEPFAISFLVTRNDKGTIVQQVANEIQPFGAYPMSFETDYSSGKYHWFTIMACSERDHI